MVPTIKLGIYNVLTPVEQKQHNILKQKFPSCQQQ